MDGLSRACAALGRILLLFSAFLIVAMPWSEKFCHLDNFPRGGEDFELSVFLIVAILGLVLVLLQHDKKGVTFLLGLRRWLSYILQGAGLSTLRRSSGLVAALHVPPLSNTFLDKYNLPLQI